MTPAIVVMISIGSPPSLLFFNGVGDFHRLIRRFGYGFRKIVDGRQVVGKVVESHRGISANGKVVEHFVIKDRGVGIADLEQARRPTFTTGGADRSGMGFTIMESFMTSFEVTSIPGKGTTVHMRRRIKQRQ